MPRTDVAKVVFQVSDVLDHAEGMDHPITGKAAQEWMANNRKHIEDAMVMAGWEAIDTLLHMDKPWEDA